MQKDRNRQARKKVEKDGKHKNGSHNDNRRWKIKYKTNGLSGIFFLKNLYYGVMKKKKFEQNVAWIHIKNSMSYWQFFLFCVISVLSLYTEKWVHFVPHDENKVRLGFWKNNNTHNFFSKSEFSGSKWEWAVWLVCYILFWSADPRDSFVRWRFEFVVNILKSLFL